MVSALWRACSEGNLVVVLELLQDASSVDVEIKDHTGVTPLIEAVKNGHVDVVRALLDRGADPTNGSSQAPPEQYTSDPTILDLLSFAQSKMVPNGMPTHENGYGNGDADKGYYRAPPGPYPYYPSITSPPPSMPEGAMYYPPQPIQPTGEQVPGGPANLPPPDIARFIPCRYFPACRYGASCMFAHPQGPYFQGPLPPPAQYPSHYDPMTIPPYVPNYYQAFPPPNGAPHMAPMSPPPPGPHGMVHARNGSEIVSPLQSPFSPSGAPPPLPYGPISPMSPGYPHPGHGAVPMSMSPMSPLHHQPQPVPGPQSPNAMYNNVPQPTPPFVVRPDAAQYSQPGMPSPVGYPEINGGPKSPMMHAQQPDPYNPIPTYREGAPQNRRGGARRPSFGGRKPPCLFFPSGRCKNGDDCRFPHVIPEGPGSHNPAYFAGRPRPRPHVNGNGNVNGFGAIEEKLAGLTVRDDTPPAAVPQNVQNGVPATIAGVDGFNRARSTDPVPRPRFQQGFKGNGNNQAVNGAREKRAAAAATRQRVPNPDEFPVLAGSTTPPMRSPPSLNGSLSGAPTAAQVLLAPAPSRKEGEKEPSVRGTSPEPTKVKELKLEPTSAPEVAQEAPTATSKLPISFAAVATGATETSKEVSVTA